MGTARMHHGEFEIIHNFVAADARRLWKMTKSKGRMPKEWSSTNLQLSAFVLNGNVEGDEPENQMALALAETPPAYRSRRKPFSPPRTGRGPR